MRKCLEKRRKVRIFRHIRNMNKLININKKTNNKMNRDIIVKSVCCSIGFVQLSMIAYAVCYAIVINLNIV